MRRFYPFIFAIVATTLAVAVTFVLVRTHVISIKPAPGTFRHEEATE